jgi:hemerythrin-like domain-containing protein
MASDPLLDIRARAGLPDALRVLLERHPRAGWRAHPEYGALTQFWLDRHLGFRRTLGALRADARAALDGRLDPRAHAARLARLGGHFMRELEGHHSVEDHVYFPKMTALQPRLERGFALLDADHHALHGELEGFASRANAVLAGGGQGALGPLEEGLTGMERFLDRHLTDEEDLIVPVILEVGEGRLA